MGLKEGEFVKIDYTATVKDSKEIFDTTRKSVADDNDLEYDEQAKFEPMIVCLGQNQLLKGLEDKLMGKDKGTYTFELPPEEAFGKKKAELLKLIPMREFKKKDIKPFPGLELNIDGKRGTVRTVSGGRVIVDFNHPLSSKHVIYDVEILGTVDDKKKQLESFLEMSGLSYKDLKVKDDKATITFNQQLPKQLTDKLEEELESVVDLKINIEPKQENKKQDKKNKKQD